MLPKTIGVYCSCNIFCVAISANSGNILFLRYLLYFNTGKNQVVIMVFSWACCKIWLHILVVKDFCNCHDAIMWTNLVQISFCLNCKNFHSIPLKHSYVQMKRTLKNFCSKLTECLKLHKTSTNNILIFFVIFFVYLL